MSDAHPPAPRYSINDYQPSQIDRALCDGIAVAMSPVPMGAHQRTLFALARRLGNAVSDSQCAAKVLGEPDRIVDPEAKFIKALRLLGCD